MINPESVFLFEELRVDGLQIHGQLKIIADWPYFEGHFPASPLLPAAALVDACVVLVQQARALPAGARLHKIRSAKFTAAVVPGRTLDMFATVQTPANELIEMDFSWRWAGETQALGEASLVFVSDNSSSTI